MADPPCGRAVVDSNGSDAAVLDSFIGSSSGEKSVDEFKGCSVAGFSIPWESADSVDCPAFPESGLSSVLDSAVDETGDSVELSRFAESNPFTVEVLADSAAGTVAFCSFSDCSVEDPELDSVVDDSTPMLMVVGDKDTKMNSGALSVESSSDVESSPEAEEDSVVEFDVESSPEVDEDSVFDSVEDSLEVDESPVVKDTKFNSVVDSFELDSCDSSEPEDDSELDSVVDSFELDSPDSSEPEEDSEFDSVVDSFKVDSSSDPEEDVEDSGIASVTDPLEEDSSGNAEEDPELSSVVDSLEVEVEL